MRSLFLTKLTCFPDENYSSVGSRPNENSLINVNFFRCCFTYGDKLYAINFIRKKLLEALDFHPLQKLVKAT